jgi:(S)-ureidoglycine aminohydrolase
MPDLPNLGHTRSANRPDHLLQTPDTFVRTPLPGLQNALAIVHTGPAAGAAFTQYTVEFASNGSLKSLPELALQRFLFVLAGKLDLQLPERTERLSPGSFAYLPSAQEHELSASASAQAVLVDRLPNPRAAEPQCLISREDACAPTPLLGDPDLEVRTLLPSHPGLDFAVNTMTYQPGAALPMVEVHIMEHGLLMLEGGGIYRLGDQWYPVSAGDFIWMAPYCPQWFGALGKQPAKYLIYKDWNQHPFTPRSAVQGELA